MRRDERCKSRVASGERRKTEPDRVGSETDAQLPGSTRAGSVGASTCHSPLATRRSRRLRGGWFSVEIVAGIIIIGVAMGLLLQTGVAYLRSRNDFMLERTLRLAAQAQLERAGAGIAPDAPPPAGFLPADVKLVTSREPGAGSWAGLTKVTVTASGEGLGGRPQRVIVRGYVKEASP